MLNSETRIAPLTHILGFTIHIKKMVNGYTYTRWKYFCNEIVLKMMTSQVSLSRFKCTVEDWTGPFTVPADYSPPHHNKWYTAKPILSVHLGKTFGSRTFVLIESYCLTSFRKEIRVYFINLITHKFRCFVYYSIFVSLRLGLYLHARTLH